MSKANGLVKFPDDKVFWCIYNGTSDVMTPVLHETNEKAWEWWRDDRGGKWPDECKHTKEKVVVYSDYGGGFYWDGKACRGCKIISYDFLEPYGDDYGRNSLIYINGKPEWAEQFLSSNEKE